MTSEDHDGELSLRERIERLERALVEKREGSDD